MGRKNEWVGMITGKEVFAFVPYLSKNSTFSGRMCFLTLTLIRAAGGVYDSQYFEEV